MWSKFFILSNPQDLSAATPDPSAPLQFAQEDILNQRYFLLTIIAALVLHLVGIYAWQLVPKMQIVDIPVHALNIKLSDGDMITSQEAKPAEPAAASAAGNAVSRLAHDEAQENKARSDAVVSSMEKAISAPENKLPPVAVPAAHAPAKSASKAVIKGKFDVRAEGVSVAAPVTSVTARQFVRENAPAISAAAEKGAGTPLGNSSAHDAEMISRYTQLISLWIQKFKIYPAEARDQGMHGETMIRINIDRQGNIRYYNLERSTGYQILDRAAIDMIRRANPVPAAPNEYPQSDLMEFLIPVDFNLQ